jgi:hypothetical protein
MFARRVCRFIFSSRLVFRTSQSEPHLHCRKSTCLIFCCFLSFACSLRSHPVAKLTVFACTSFIRPMTAIQPIHRWVKTFDEETARAVVQLVDCASEDGGTLGYRSPMAPEESRSFIAELAPRVAAGESHVLLGHVDGVPAFLCVLTCNAMPNCRHRAELTKGVVSPEFRGRRLVQIALKELVQKASQVRVDQFVLDVREGSRAHLLWQQFGFKSFGVLSDYARIDGQTYQGHFMMQTVESLHARLTRTQPQTKQLMESFRA